MNQVLDQMKEPNSVGHAPKLAAACHTNYMKSARLYLQQMNRLNMQGQHLSSLSKKACT